MPVEGLRQQPPELRSEIVQFVMKKDAIVKFLLFHFVCRLRRLIISKNVLCPN